MKRSLQHRTINRLAAFSVLGYAVQAAAHLVPPTNLHVSTTYNSFQYWFIRGEATWPQAADACQAVGGSLLSLSNADEALNTVWSPSVTEHSLQDSFWTGLTVSWPNGRRRMRSFALSKNIQTEIAPAIIHDEDSSRSSAGMETSGNALSYQSSGSGRRVPLSTGVNGRLVPDQVRQWQLLQERQGSRSLLGRKARARAGSDATDGDDRFNLKGAVFTWADGSDTNLIKSNPDSLAFLRCDKEQASECCGVVYDVPQDQYPGSPIPVIFFEPCDQLRTNYICKMQGDGSHGDSDDTLVPGPPTSPSTSPPIKDGSVDVAELPRTGTRPPQRNNGSSDTTSLPSSTSKPKGRKQGLRCLPGTAPQAGDAGEMSCVVCPTGQVSYKGRVCAACPGGKVANAAGTRCNKKYTKKHGPKL